jgi:molybdate transport system substrate-binding protein
VRKFFFIFLLASFSNSAFAKQITVAASANLQGVLQDLKKIFEEQTAVQVQMVMASSGKLTAQIQQGAPFDLFLSADLEYPEYLFQNKGTIGSPKIYAYGTLVLWSLKDWNGTETWKLLKDKNIRNIALPNPKTAPYGKQALAALNYYQIYPHVQDKLVYGENVLQTSQFILLQIADIGFTAKSVVLSPALKQQGHWIEVDPKAYDPIPQGMVILKYAKTKNLKEAQQFFDFLSSDAAKEIFKKYGYKLP